jgi:putative endonuclease
MPTHNTTTATGRAAEELAATHLAAAGFTILDRNWRNRWCELDIVARRAGRVHIIEVKYRRSAAYGAPLEYISHDKINRLTRAANAWIQAHQYRGPYQIDAISVLGAFAHPAIEHLENIIEA